MLLPWSQGPPLSLLRPVLTSLFCALTHPYHLSLCSPGIGGFMVRQRKSHTRLKKVSAVLAEVGREGLSTDGHPEDGRAWGHPRSLPWGAAATLLLEQPQTGCGEGVNRAAVAGAPGDLPAEGGLDPGSGEGDEKKKRRGRKKSKLEDMFPPYLQVGHGGGFGAVMEVALGHAGWDGGRRLLRSHWSRRRSSGRR